MSQLKKTNPLLSFSSLAGLATGAALIAAALPLSALADPVFFPGPGPGRIGAHPVAGPGFGPFGPRPGAVIFAPPPRPVPIAWPAPGPAPAPGPGPAWGPRPMPPRPPIVRPAPGPFPGGPGPGPGYGPGHGHGPIVAHPRPGGRLRTPPPANSADDETDSAALVSGAIGDMGCERAGEALRRISNMLLSNVQLATEREPHDLPGDPRNAKREEMRRRWAEHMRNPVFWQKVWNRLADMYRSCDIECFDDGVAVGQISGAGYCAASVGVGGLNGVGSAYQAPLPLCQNATFTGCQTGYDQAASTYQGCSTYTSGGYTSIFNEFKSQDCHID
jgi:hypothetical protein